MSANIQPQFEELNNEFYPFVLSLKDFGSSLYPYISIRIEL